MRWLLVWLCVISSAVMADGTVVNVFDTKVTDVMCDNTANLMNLLVAACLCVLAAALGLCLDWMFSGPGSGELGAVGGLILGAVLSFSLFSVVDYDCRMVVVDEYGENYMVEDIVPIKPKEGDWVKLVYVGDFKYVIVQ